MSAAGSAERVADLVRGMTTKFSANWVLTLTSGWLQVGVAATLLQTQHSEGNKEIKIPTGWQCMSNRTYVRFGKCRDRGNDASSTDLTR